MTSSPPTAVVTGAGSGIGRAVAVALLERGHRVALAGRRAAPLEETAAAAPDRALVVPTDVRDPAAVRALFAAVRDAWGRLDLLFNNAGTFGRQVRFDQVTDEQWRDVVDTNLTGCFLCAREAFALMRDQRPQGGRIINNGSISAHVPRPHSAAYTATKHALTGLTRAILLDGRPVNVACGQIDIGNAATEMTATFGTGALQADGEMREEPRTDLRHSVDAVLYMAGLPLDANVPFLTVMATGMPFIGRG
jgi:NAD(P)-dependent dehydrogenase (short-subunit alcohol dehydrogenase family)